MWQTVKPKYCNMSNRVGETEMQQTTEPVLTSNRYVLSNFPEHVPSVSSPCNNRRMDLFMPSATKLRTKSQRYMAKRPKYHHHHHTIQQEVSTTKMEYEEGNHLSCDSKHYQIPIIINGHVNSPPTKER
jgi:hypothetical protein